MIISVITKNFIEGIHYWIGAKDEVNFLQYPHRHIFHITCKFEVEEKDRQIEIIKKQHDIDCYITKKYGFPAMFNEMSCEMIAEEILMNFEKCFYCEVLEDGFGGASVERGKYV